LEPVCISRKPPRSPSGGIKPHRPAAITGKILGVSILEEALSVITRPGKNLLLVYSYALHSQSPGALRLLAKRAPLSPRLRNGSPASARIRRLCRCVRPCGSCRCPSPCISTVPTDTRSSSRSHRLQWLRLRPWEEP